LTFMADGRTVCWTRLSLSSPPRASTQSPHLQKAGL
jgi:hypothetical protein